ncbi:hypothetical protein U1E44_01580 [Arenibacter sp. GZD96]|nr:hypothetical protein [Arenibacter sp. GZD-96]MEA1784769.1 hypothetical protein [Arenibacter sp. GZD-96]
MEINTNYQCFWQSASGALEARKSAALKDYVKLTLGLECGQ